MTDPIAVLLIVGNVLIGPIAPKVVGEAEYKYFFPDGAEGFVMQGRTNWDGIRVPYCAPEPDYSRSWEDELLRPCARKKTRSAKAETVAETCARAMKEIGAKKRRDEQMNIERWFVGNNPYWGANDEVRCIPAPSGLKRP